MSYTCATNTEAVKASDADKNSIQLQIYCSEFTRVTNGSVSSRFKRDPDYQNAFAWSVDIR